MSEPSKPETIEPGGSGWRSAHASKIMSLAGAIARIRPGRRILIGSGAAEPVRLVEALARDGHHLADNEIVHLLTLGPAPYVRPELAARFRHSAFFIGPNVREAVQDGRADFIPVFLSEIPELIRSRRVRIDVALIQTCVPDAHGYVSLGVSVDVVRAAVDSADLVLAEVNPHMPRTHGDSFLHVSRIDAMVPVDEPLLEHVSPPPGEIERAIGEHVARLVPDGATLQAGIGSILLMRRMLDAARANGLRGFSADVMAGNRGMLMVFQKSGLTVQSRFDGSVYHLEMPFDEPPPLSQQASAVQRLDPSRTG
jgi:acyl-CoA hydrolase